MRRKLKKNKSIISNQNLYSFIQNDNIILSKVKEDKTDLGKMLEESFYNALRRYEDERKPKKEDNNRELKEKKWVTILLFIFFPFALRNNKKNINNNYDIMLTMLVSFILDVLGTILWMLGFGIPIINIYKFGFRENSLIFIGIGLILVTFGSIIMISGKAFSEEKDSAKIHAFSASIFALISCIIAIVALIK